MYHAYILLQIPGFLFKQNFFHLKKMLELLKGYDN